LIQSPVSAARVGGLTHAPVILHPPAVGENEIATLGRVHGTATAQAEDRVNARRLRNGHAILHAFGGGILPRLVEHRHRQPERLQIFLHARRVSRRDDARIRDEQHFFNAQLARQLAHALNAINAKDHARTRLQFK
jgi:hypothetical protein